jgi:hypothetical protein
VSVTKSVSGWRNFGKWSENEFRSAAMRYSYAGACREVVGAEGSVSKKGVRRRSVETASGGGERCHPTRDYREPIRHASPPSCLVLPMGGLTVWYKIVCTMRNITPCLRKRFMASGLRDN